MNYVRFITPRHRLRRDIDSGLFGPAYDLLWDGEVDDGLRAAVRHQVDYFEHHLPVPRHSAFRVKSCRRWYSDGICWFVGSADRMVAEAFILASLLELAGVPVRKLATHRPGTVFYRDPYQVVRSRARRRRCCSTDRRGGGGLARRRLPSCSFTARRETMTRHQYHDDQPCFRADQQAA